jgi:hypothetical protein
MVLSAEFFDAEAVAVVVAEDESAVGAVVDEQLESDTATHAARPARRMKHARGTIITATPASAMGFAVPMPITGFTRRRTRSRTLISPYQQDQRLGDSDRELDDATTGVDYFWTLQQVGVRVAVGTHDSGIG